MMTTRQEIFAQAAKKLRQDFGELSTVPHNLMKGQEAERIVRTFLSHHLPKRFAVGSGFIIDPNDSVSKQTDVIIYDAINCPVLRASDIAAIFPSDNVTAIVEVKSQLDKQRLEEAFENISAAKSLTKTQLPELPILQTNQTFGCIFAFESSLTLNTLTQHYADLVRERGVGRHVDLILVLDRGLINLAGKPRGLDWAPLVVEGLGGPRAEGAHIAAMSSDLGENSLDWFLRFLLAHLIHYRWMTNHPGFFLNKPAPSQGIMAYIGSITKETDPVKRDEILKKYQEEVVEEFKRRPPPPA
jgi:hypothetical protein